MALAGSGFAQTTLFESTGTKALHHAGFSIASSGDLDGDGVADLLIGRPGDVSISEPDWVPGDVIVRSGATGAILLSFGTPNGIERFGWSVAAGGDLDLDGVVDVLIGSNVAGDSLIAPQTRARAFSGATGALLHEWKSIPNEKIGLSVAGAGDLDGDGRSDVLAYGDGAPGGIQGAGSVTAFSSGSGAQLFHIVGTTPYGHFGSKLARLDDLDGDGAPEFVTSTSGVATGYGTTAMPGTTMVRSGKTGALLWQQAGVLADESQGGLLAAVSDRDGDGAQDVATGSPTTGVLFIRSSASGAILRTIQIGTHGAVVCGAGDHDGDGREDYAVGYPYGFTIAVGDPGMVRVFSGASGAPISTRLGTKAAEQFGNALAPLGDVDSDGSIEFAAGASYYGPGFPLPPKEGRVVVLTPCDDPTGLVGPGCAGSLPNPPALDVNGCFYSGGNVTLVVTHAPANGAALLLAGAAASIPVSSGCTLFVGLAPAFALVLDATGSAQVSGNLPHALPTSGVLRFQVVAAAAGGGISATPALGATLHP